MRPAGPLSRPLWFGFLLALSLTGCSDRPKAPVLRDEPVYENDRAGFRFLAPEGWTLQTKADVPPGRIDKPRRLATYQRLRGDKGATFEVSVLDLPPSASLEALLAERSFGADAWKLTGQAEPLTIQGAPATRLVFSSKVRRQEMTKDVVVFRRDERVYLFTGIYTASDAKAREQVRRAIGSTTWR